MVPNNVANHGNVFHSTCSRKENVWGVHKSNSKLSNFFVIFFLTGGIFRGDPLRGKQLGRKHLSELELPCSVTLQRTANCVRAKERKKKRKKRKKERKKRKKRKKGRKERKKERKKEKKEGKEERKVDVELLLRDRIAKNIHSH